MGSYWAVDQTGKRLGLKWSGQLPNGKCSCSSDNFSKSKVGQSNTFVDWSYTPQGNGDTEQKLIQTKGKLEQINVKRWVFRGGC